MPKYGPSDGSRTQNIVAVAEPAEGVGEADGRGGLAFALGGERHRRDEVQATVRLIVAGVELINRHFGEVVAVAKNAIGIQTQFLGDSRDPAGRKTEGKTRPRQT